MKSVKNWKSNFYLIFLGKQNETSLITPKASQHSKKLMLCITWHWNDIVNYILKIRRWIQTNTVPNWTSKRKQSMKNGHQKCVVFHQDNATPHIHLFVDPAEIGTAWLGCPTSSAVLPWLHTFGLSSSVKMESWSYLTDKER